MDTGSWFSVMNVVLVVVGGAIGAVAGHFASPSIGEAKRLRGELDRMLREHETYRASVDAHFRKTADLVGQMTKSYAAVYDHLAGGARTFCDDSGPGQKLPFEPLPGALAWPVVETSPDASVAVDWPTDVMLDDTADDATDGSQHDVASDESSNADGPDDATTYPRP
jgi:uncharacterized membrane-anchored protein YhcB (DUF1043 family)